MENLLNESLRLEQELKQNISAKLPTDDSVSTCRKNLRNLYEDIILEDFKFASMKEVDISLWKNIYYKSIELFRKKIKFCAPESKSELFELFQSYLHEGFGFYFQLIFKICVKEKVCIKHFFNRFGMTFPDITEGQASNDAESFVYKLLVFAGDLARYQSQYCHDANKNEYNAARWCYLEACRLQPKFGNANNQLAVIECNLGHQFEGVYYYYKSLMVSIPFSTAKTNLQLLLKKIECGNSYFPLLTIHKRLLEGEKNNFTIDLDYVKSVLTISDCISTARLFAVNAALVHLLIADKREESSFEALSLLIVLAEQSLMLIMDSHNSVHLTFVYLFFQWLKKNPSLDNRAHTAKLWSLLSDFLRDKIEGSKIDERVVLLEEYELFDFYHIFEPSKTTSGVDSDSERLKRLKEIASDFLYSKEDTSLVKEEEEFSEEEIVFSVQHSLKETQTEREFKNIMSVTYEKPKRAAKRNNISSPLFAETEEILLNLPSNIPFSGI